MEPEQNPLSDSDNEEQLLYRPQSIGDRVTPTTERQSMHKSNPQPGTEERGMTVVYKAVIHIVQLNHRTESSLGKNSPEKGRKAFRYSSETQASPSRKSHLCPKSKMQDRNCSEQQRPMTNAQLKRQLSWPQRQAHKRFSPPTPLPTMDHTLRKHLPFSFGSTNC